MSLSKKKKARRAGRIKHVKEAAKAVDPTAPLAERYKSYHHEGKYLGHGIESIDVDVTAGGQVVGRAHINRLERSALDGLEEAGVLNDPRDSSAAKRRKAAGLFLWQTWFEAKIESHSTGLYDKVTGEMMPSGPPPPKSNNALNAEVKFYRLMDRCKPFHTVVRNVCCYNERPPMVVRDGLLRPCNWDEALRKGLDIIADIIASDMHGRVQGRGRGSKQAQTRHKAETDTMPA
jgi:hypothetical protein